MRKRCDSKVSHLEDCEEVQIISRVWNVLFREAEAKEKKKVERKNLNFSSCLKKKVCGFERVSKVLNQTWSKWQRRRGTCLLNCVNSLWREVGALKQPCTEWIAVWENRSTGTSPCLLPRIFSFLIHHLYQCFNPAVENFEGRGWF